MSKTMIFTNTDLIKRARKIGRVYQTSYGIDKMSSEEFQELSRQMSHLNSVFFNLSKDEKNPEKSYLMFTMRGILASKKEDEKLVKLACGLLNTAATSLIRERILQLQQTLDLKEEEFVGLKWYRAYEKVRKGGKYNMITEAQEAAAKAGLTIEQYKYVIKNYTDLKASVIMIDTLSEPAPF